MLQRVALLEALQSGCSAAAARRAVLGPRRRRPRLARAPVAERADAGAAVLLTDHSGSAAGRVALDRRAARCATAPLSTRRRCGRDARESARRAGGARANAVTVRATHPDGRAFERTLAATASDDLLRALLDAGWHVEEVRR